MEPSLVDLSELTEFKLEWDARQMMEEVNAFWIEQAEALMEPEDLSSVFDKPQVQEAPKAKRGRKPKIKREEEQSCIHCKE
jgi:hypothetical protein